MQRQGELSVLQLTIAIWADGRGCLFRTCLPPLKSCEAIAYSMLRQARARLLR